MSSPFLKRAAAAIGDPALQQQLDRNADGRQAARRSAWTELPDIDDLRDRAQAVRRTVINDLDRHLRKFEQRLAGNRIQVHHARDATHACQIITQIAQSHRARLVAKSKSMVTEEIGLNDALESAGIRVVETDLGEFIVQLRRERPSHILTPALHLSKEQVAQTFRETLRADVTDDVEQLNQAARRSLREVFHAAPIGITGVNFGVAETGTLALVTNEGNGRMVNTLPPVHIAVMGIERLVPTLPDLALMLRLLPRSATGQKATSYVSLIHGPRQTAEPDGAEERHLVLVDNGRSRMRSSPLAEALDCIRCGACLNACPVFRESGGHAYGSVYPGPIGSIVSPGLFGVEQFGHLARASSLCGACAEACPVGIDLPSLLLKVRAQPAQPASELRTQLRWYAWVARSPRRYRWAQRLAALASRLLPRSNGWVRQLPGPLAAWTRLRDFPPFAAKPLRARLKQRPRAADRHPEIDPLVDGTKAVPPPSEQENPDRFSHELSLIGGEVIRCGEDELPDRLVGQLFIAGAGKVLSWGPVEPILYVLNQRLEQDGFELQLPELPRGAGRQAAISQWDQAQVGITGAVAAFADTGTIALSSSSRRSLLPSLLPETHFVVLRAKDIYDSFEHWLERGGGGYISNSSNLVLISGPSRTADIEMTLTTGVHGPRQLTVFLIE